MKGQFELLVCRFANILSLFFSPIIKLVEYPLFLKFGRSEKYAPLFIVGAPRTGSTILYQYITNVHDVLYYDNFVCLFFRNPRFGFWLDWIVYSGKPHNNFQAEHGNTAKHGLRAPSECGQFWYRWLPRDRHFIDHHEVTDKMVRQIGGEINTVMKYFGKPMVFKNLNAGQRLRLLSKAFPGAKVLYIKRDPFYTAQSIYLARKSKKVKENEWWSIKPKNFRSLQQENELKMSAAQVYFLEKQIEEDLTLFPQEQTLTIQYEDLCKNTETWLESIDRYVGAGKRSGDAHVPEFAINNRIKLEDSMAEELRGYIDEYYGS